MQRNGKYRKAKLLKRMTSRHVVIDNAYVISVFVLIQEHVSVVNVDKGEEQS